MPKVKNQYFTIEHENAIVQYAASKDLKERTRLYISLIQPALDEMVDKIIYTYRFNTLANIDSLREECKVWLTTTLDKFNQDRGFKAFSYFSVITKNWFIHKVKKSTQANKKEIQYEQMPKDIECKMSIGVYYEEKREYKEFFSHLLEEIDKWDTGLLRENEKKVLDAIRILFDMLEDIEIFNKKAFYLYLREITNLPTKQVVASLNKIRTRYFAFKHKWDSGDI